MFAVICYLLFDVAPPMRLTRAWTRIRDEERGFTSGPQRSRQMSSADLEERFRVSQDRAQIEEVEKKNGMYPCVRVCVRASVKYVCVFRDTFSPWFLFSCKICIISVEHERRFEREWEKQRSVFAHDCESCDYFRVSTAYRQPSYGRRLSLFLSFFLSRDLSTSICESPSS